MSAEFRIAVIGGDGIGPEVTEQAIRVAEAAVANGGATAGAANGGRGARCAPAASSFSVGDILAGVPLMAKSSCSWLLASAARRRTPLTINAPDLVATAWESLLFVRPSQMP